jgi:hypothetical protein
VIYRAQSVAFSGPTNIGSSQIPERKTMFSIFRRNKQKKETAVKERRDKAGNIIPPKGNEVGYTPSSASSYKQPVSHIDDVLSNVWHPANPFNPAYSNLDSSPSSDNSCSHDSSYSSSHHSSSSYDSCSSSSYDSGSSSSYDSGSSSSSSFD